MKKGVISLLAPAEQRETSQLLVSLRVLIVICLRSIQNKSTATEAHVATITYLLWNFQMFKTKKVPQQT